MLFYKRVQHISLDRNKIAVRAILKGRSMLLILFGTKDRRKLEAKGQFICPKCGLERDYEAISVREWFTLFFIPILPTANHERRDYFIE